MFGRSKRDVPASAERGDERPTPADGPHERSSVRDVAEYYTDLGFGHVDLGSMVIGVPPGRDLNVVLDPNGQPEFHVLTESSRVIPHVYAAPKSAGQWRSWVTELREQLEAQDATVEIEDGPWGREVVATLPGAVFRVIGADGPRWMAEVRVMSVAERADVAAEEGREVLRHLLVHRGDGPMPVREHLPVSVPEEVQQALVQAQQQMAAQQQAQAYQQQMAAQGGQAPGQPAQVPGQGAQAAGQDAAAQGRGPVDGAGGAPAGGAARREGSAMDRLRDGDAL